MIETMKIRREYATYRERLDRCNRVLATLVEASVNGDPVGKAEQAQVLEAVALLSWIMADVFEDNERQAQTYRLLAEAAELGKRQEETPSALLLTRLREAGIVHNAGHA